MASSAAAGVVEPLLSPVEVTAPPAQWEPLEKSFSKFMSQKVPIESDGELRRRERVMDELKTVFQQWVFDVCRSQGLSEDLARGAGGKIYTSGSYRLRVHEPGADIDSVGVAPKHCTRTDFFDTFKKALENHPLVENLRSIETAVVPIMTFDMDEVNIDMLFAQLPLNEVPDSVDIDDDNILHSVDEATEKSLNGPRVTNLIYKLVAHNYDSFLQVLRVARNWGKARGLYSNKMGYLGGVNFNILVALVCQLFPNATPAYLLCKFFHFFAQWQWPSPAILCRPVDHGLGFQVWNPNNHLYGRAAAEHARANLMPIVTPAYPAMNSAANVNPWTFKVITDEFKRASLLCKDIEAAHLSPSKHHHDLAKVWEKLLEPTDFFAKYDAYLAVKLVHQRLPAAAKTDEEEDAPPPPLNPIVFDEFKGYITSRLRKLVERLGNLPFSQVHLYPKEFAGADDEEESSASYFVGLVEDAQRLREGESLVLTHVWTSFWEKDVQRFKGLDETLDIRLEHLKWSQLPESVFAEGQKTLFRRMRARKQRERALALQAAADAQDDDDGGNDKGAVGENAPTKESADAAKADEEDVEEEEEEEEELLGLWNLPDALPKLGPVVPKWHPMAKKENRDPAMKTLSINFLPNSPEMIDRRREEYIKATKKKSGLEQQREPAAEELADEQFFVKEDEKEMTDETKSAFPSIVLRLQLPSDYTLPPPPPVCELDGDAVMVPAADVPGFAELGGRNALLFSLLDDEEEKHHHFGTSNKSAVAAQSTAVSAARKRPLLET